MGSFDALAAALEEESPGQWLLAADAQRREFAVASARDGCLVTPVRLIAGEALAACIVAGERAAGTDAASVGQGALLRCPTAGWVARIAATGHHDVAAESLAPMYLREAGFLKAAPTRLIPGFTDTPD